MRLANRVFRAALRIATVFLALLLVCSVYLPVSARAQDPSQGSAKLPGWSRHGSPHALRRVYVANVLALRVVQQPAGNDAFVSAANDEVTQFSWASKYGNIGLLAHNYLSGWSFSRLAIGQTVRLVYADGKIEDFIVTEVLRFQALQPHSPLSSFRNLANDEIMTSRQVFGRVYAGQHHLTFQTCIAEAGNLSWGRLFVLAMPAHAQRTGNGPKPLG
jgi:hypothetical protein